MGLKPHSLKVQYGTTEVVPLHEALRFTRGIEVHEMMAKKTDSGSGKIHLKWVRSAICAPVKQKRVIKGLGFTRLNQVIERPDNNAIRGMVAKVPHLVEFLKE
jgi:large subunit ribosomal protein L30